MASMRMFSIRMAAKAAIAVFLLAAIAAVLDFPVMLRFADPATNYRVAAAIAIVVPLLLILLAFLFVNRNGRVVCLMLAAMWVLPAVPYTWIALIEAKHVSRAGMDASFALLDERRVRGDSYRLYLSDCGATCSYGLVLRAEKDIGLGLRVVRTIWSKYKTQSHAELRTVDETHLEVIEEGVGITLINL